MTSEAYQQSETPNSAEDALTLESDKELYLRAWQFTHPFFSEPLITEGLHSKNVMLHFALAWLHREFPSVDWLEEMKNIEQIEIPLEGF
jgi:hypothetical protein